MPARWLPALACGASLAVMGFTAPARAAPDVAGASVTLAPSAPVVPSPSTWLRRIGQAAAQTNYDGVVMIASPGRTSTVQIKHRHDGAGQTDVIESLDGPLRQVYRHNDEVRMLWPDSKTGLIRQHDAALGFPRQWSQADERVLDFFEVSLLGRQRWAGQQAVVLQLRPRDAYRYGQRLWVDEQGGLVLKAETLAPQGQVLEWAAFTQLTLSPSSGPVTMPDPAAMRHWRWMRSTLKPTSLQQEGWQVVGLPPGFRLQGCVRRPGGPLPLGAAVNAVATVASHPQAPVRTASGPDLMQAIFSDGVSHVSVFIERFDPQRHHRELLLLQGATQTLQRRQDAWWITVVGDVPAPAVQRFGAAFKRF